MNKLLKTLIAGLLIAVPALQAQIELHENLSITGFLDMSASNFDSDLTDSSDSFFNLDQAEIDFLLDFDEITGRIDLNYLGDNDTEEFDLEQAFLSYDFGDGLNVEAGKYRSWMNFESFEPTGLYQFSRAYDMRDTLIGHHNGVRVNYGDDAVNFGLSVVDSVFDPDGSLEDSEIGIEAKMAFFPAEGWTVFLGFAKDSMDVGSDRDFINFWTSYEIGNVTWALEFNDYDFGPQDIGNQILLMANVGITDNASVTFRVSEDEQDFKGGDTSTKFTISPGWSINDNLGVLFEASQSDFGSEGEVTSFAFETIFTF